MFRPASRCLLRQPIRPIRASFKARPLSTAPPHLKSRSWKSSATRWGLAVAGIYYYNTSTLFAEEPAFSLHEPPLTGIEDEPLPTLASLSPSSKSQPPTHNDLPSVSSIPSSSSPPSIDPKSPIPEPNHANPEQQAAQDLEEDASQQGAFNEETGEINWDCPCLGGMAHGPCGEEFRTAFSCFVFSKEEPKGMDCIDKFKGMQGCFQEHPDIYGSQLEDNEDEDGDVEGVGAAEEGSGTSPVQPGGIPEADNTKGSAASNPKAGTGSRTGAPVTQPEHSVTESAEGSAASSPKAGTGSRTGAPVAQPEHSGTESAEGISGAQPEGTPGTGAAKGNEAEVSRPQPNDLPLAATTAKTSGQLSKPKERRSVYEREKEATSKGSEAKPDSRNASGTASGKLLSDKSHATSGAQSNDFHGDDLVPKAAHDTKDSGTEK